MKKKIRDEYIRRVKKICRSKLNGGNLVDGIKCVGSWCGKIQRRNNSWTKEELKEIDRKTRKVLSLIEFNFLSKVRMVGSPLVTIFRVLP